METVTSSDLVRHFGIWRDRALARPVYVQHHGRAKLVLASVDFMEHLVSSRTVDDPARSIPSLLEAVDGIILVVDDRCRLLGATSLGRRHLLRADVSGENLGDLLVESIRGILRRAVRVTLESAETERFQLRIGQQGERRLDVAIRPFGGGACLVAQDRTASDRAAEAIARGAAIDQALSLLGDIATLRINLRGYIVDTTAALEAMTGLSAAGYRSVRFPTLFDLPTRVGVGDALERVIETLTPQHVRARLISSEGQAISVRLALSAEVLRASGDMVIATLAIDHSNSSDG